MFQLFRTFWLAYAAPACVSFFKSLFVCTRRSVVGRAHGSLVSFSLGIKLEVSEPLPLVWCIYDCTYAPLERLSLYDHIFVVRDVVSLFAPIVSVLLF